METVWHGARISPCVKMALSMYCGPQPFWNIPYISRTVNWPLAKALSFLCISCISCKIKQTRIKNWPQNIAFFPQTSNYQTFLSSNQLTYSSWNLPHQSPPLTFTFATLDYPLHPPIPLSNLPLSLDPPLRLVHAWSSQTFKSSLPYSSLLCAIISSLFWLYLITAIPGSISHIPSPSLFSFLHSPTNSTTAFLPFTFNTIHLLVLSSRSPRPPNMDFSVLFSPSIALI